MRKVINISLPVKMASFVQSEVEAGDFASTSEFFRYLLRQWEEARLLANVKASQKEIARDKGKILHSLKDLR